MPSVRTGAFTDVREGAADKDVLTAHGASRPQGASTGAEGWEASMPVSFPTLLRDVPEIAIQFTLYEK